MPRSTANANNGVRHRPAAIARCRYAEHTPVRNVACGTRSATRGIAIPASILVPPRDQIKVGRFMNFEVPYRSFWARTWRVPGGWSLADGFGDRRGREFTPTRRPP